MASRVRILTIEPDDLLRVESLRRQKAKPAVKESEDEAEDEAEAQANAEAMADTVRRREREITQVRHHAFLRQTVPPHDPLVREIERRRSGSGNDED